METPLANQVAQLSPRHPVRRLAEVILARKPLPYGGAFTLLDHALDASPRSWPAQVIAVRLLGRLADEQTHHDEIVRALSTLLRDEGAPSDARVYRGLLQTVAATTITVLALTACGAGVSGAGLLKEDAWTSLAGSVLGFGYLALISTALGLLCLLPSNTLARSFAARDGRSDLVREAAAESLGELGAIGGISALAFAAMDASPQVRKAARANLHRLVPLLRVEDFGMFEADTVPNLCHMLRAEEEESSLLALHALQIVGDGRAIRPVAHLAASRCPSKVREAAERLLPLLKERHAAAIAPTRLLRPSFAPGLNDDLLLMAVRNHPTDHLPRPAPPE